MPKLSEKQIGRLVMRCIQPEKKFRELGEWNSKDETIFIDRGGSILAVAHLDTVKHNRPILSDNHIITGTLDDRLGAWGILDALPKLTRTRYDILLTTDEERGDSSAGRWTVPEGKKYNWMFELDRRGLDVVTYCYKSKEWEKTLEDAGFKIGVGSFSDISYLERLGCCGVNFGIGYHNEHSNECHADLSEVAQRIADIAKFITAHSKTYFEHTTPSEYPKRGRSQWQGSTHYSGGGYTNSYYGDTYSTSSKKGAGVGSSTKAYDGDQRFTALERQEAEYESTSKKSGGGHNSYKSADKSLDCGKCGAFTELWWNYCAECGFKLTDVANIYDFSEYSIE